MRYLMILLCVGFGLLNPVVAKEYREVKASIVINAPIEKAYDAWTSTEGITSFIASAGLVEKKPGGRYEVYFLPEAEAGTRGSDNGTTILALDENRMVSFTWGMPPYMPDIRPHLTTVMVYFETLSEGNTKVTLYHVGFGSGQQWDKGYQYFIPSWPIVLANFKRAMEVGPIDWDAYLKEYQETGTISWWQAVQQ